MKSLYKLITKTNLKSPSILFPLVFPLIFILLYSVGINDGITSVELDALVATFFVTIFSITTMQTGLMGFGINFVAIKESVLIRRIGATELNKLDVILSLLFYGLTVWLISAAWIFLTVIIFSGIGTFYSVADDGSKVFVTNAAAWMQYVNWGKFLCSTIVMLFASFSLGIFFTSIAPNDQSYMAMAMLYFFFAGFMGGLLFPGDVPNWIEYIGYVIPHSYVGFLNDWAAGTSIETWQTVTGFIVPIVFGIVVLGASVKLLKFD
ncbi:MAG: hypothetical protein TYPL_4870 [Candidatus Tyloplasma litorale]|nr:MAG: hypothetical protein TYPL_4870 [Mycoplasmatales bacterium]